MGRKTALLAACLVVSSSAWAQVVFDTSVTANASSFSITTAQPGELILIAGDGWGNTSPTVPPKFTVDGSAATQIAFVQSIPLNTGGASVFYYVAPAAGVHNIVETSTGTYKLFNPPNYILNFAVALQNASTSGLTFATNTSATNSVSVSLAATAGSYLFFTPNCNSGILGSISWTGNPSAPVNISTLSVGNGIDSAIASINPAVAATYTVTATDSVVGSHDCIVAVQVLPTPARVNNLALNTPTQTSMNATWSEPSGDAGAAADLRWLDRPIVTQADFLNANQVNGVPAGTGNTGANVQVPVTSLPPDTLVYFAIEYVSPLTGRAQLSNVPSLETQEDQAPTQVTDLKIVSIVGSQVTVQWTNTGEHFDHGTNQSADFRMRLGQGCVSLTAADFANPVPAGVTVIPNPPAPLAPGVVQTFTFDLGAPFTQFAVGMVNYDDPEAGVNPTGIGPVCNQPVCGATGSPVWQAASIGSDSGGGISNNPTNSVNPVLAINPDTDLPGVAWTDISTVSHFPAIYFRELQGGTWTEFGGSASAGGVSNGAAPAQYPSLAYDDSGNPYIAWQNGVNIFVRTSNGGAAFAGLGGSDAGTGISGAVTPSGAPSIAVNPANNHPGVAWSGYQAGTYQIYFREFDGAGTWLAFGGSGGNFGVSGQDGSAAEPSLAYDGSGHPIIAWAGGGGSQIYARRFDGSAWVEMAGSGSGQGISNNSLANRHPSIQTDDAGNPYVVWEADPGNGSAQIFGRTFNGVSWVDFGAGSSSGGGISATPKNSRRPSLSKSTSADRTFFLVWNDYSDPDGLAEVYGKYYSDGLWRTIGTASASNGGITNSPVATAQPSCGLAGGEVPTAYVAWSAGAGSQAEVYVKSLLLIDGGADSPKEIVVGGGQGGAGQYRVFDNGVRTPAYQPLDLRTAGWAAYNALNGTLHPACGDVEGIGLDDVVVGLGTYRYGGGFFAIFRDNQGQFQQLAGWLRFPWSAYDAANGELFPAVGDLDSDGGAEIVLGQGAYAGAGGYCAVFSDMQGGFRFLGWIHGGAGVFNGEVHPAIGDVGEGRNSIVLGFGQGSGGLVQVLDDRLHGYASLGRMTYANATYDLQNGTTWPTVAGAAGYVGPQVIVGPGRGGSGVAHIYGGAATGFNHVGSMQLPWGAYDAQVGELRVSAGTTDASGYPSVVAGLGSFPSAGGWLYVFAGVSAGSRSGTWIRYTNGNPVYNSTNGETFPAVGQVR